MLGVDHQHHPTNKDAHNSNNWAPPMNCSTLAEVLSLSPINNHKYMCHILIILVYFSLFVYSYVYKYIYIYLCAYGHS